MEKDALVHAVRFEDEPLHGIGPEAAPASRPPAVAPEDLSDTMLGGEWQEGPDGVLAVENLDLRLGFPGPAQILAEDLPVGGSEVVLPDADHLEIAVKPVGLAAAAMNHHLLQE